MKAYCWMVTTKGIITKRKFTLTQVYDTNENVCGTTYNPAKLYVTAEDKDGNVGYIIECEGVFWLDAKKPLGRLDKAKRLLNGYIHSLRCCDKINLKNQDRLRRFIITLIRSHCLKK